MFTLLIADDEPLAQVGLKSMLDWESLDVSIVGTSPNGLHALEAIMRLRPDIVITDVRMPMLDGISLVERCRAELDFSPEFIVLTGYGDFDSARRSLRCDVVDFLVKLELDESMLRTSVERAKSAVREKRRSGLSPRGGAGRSDPFAETALTRLFTGCYADSGEARASLAKSGIEVGTGTHCVVFFKVDYPNAGRLSEDERLRAYCCAVDMIRELVGREAAVLVVPFDTSGFAALLTFQPLQSDGASPDGAESAGDTVRRAVLAIERAREVTQKFFGVELRAGIGSAHADLARAAESYREAIHSIRVASGIESGSESGASGRGRAVVSYTGLRGLSGQSGTDGPGGQGGTSARANPATRRAAVTEAVAGVSSSNLRAVIGETLRDLASADMTAPEALALCCEILYPVLERQEGGEALLDSFFADEQDGYRCLFSAGNIARMRSWLEIVRDGLCARFESTHTRGRNPLVAGVRNYVLQNYAEKFVLGDVAKRFQVSPNHLSSVFKKYNGAGFAEFVAQVKVEKAKALLGDGGYRMFEVAQLLGFDDAFYFSKVFKKIAGMSPREYCASMTVREPSAEAHIPEESKHPEKAKQPDDAQS